MGHLQLVIKEEFVMQHVKKHLLFIIHQLICVGKDVIMLQEE